MANNRIGCNSGKTLLVDPNKFDGQSSFTNMSVPLEDLSISVELTTSKKARTVLISKTDGSNIINQGQNTDDVTIRFLEGSTVSGQKVLTTAYTDLTTSFEKGNNGENLGMTNIDIDFSSAYAPQITISFIDIRGSAIFQNEANAANDINKYSVFFQLPYPIYQLTIKGYYGKPVKYCLHMTKFNSRFNSQTGNFEITATYIGYTYAMLTDMLMGYLKAIPYTDLGKKRFEALQQKDSTLITLNELSSAISKINVLAEKIKSDDPDSKSIADSVSKLDLLSAIESNLNILGTDLDIKQDLQTYRYIIMNSTQSTTSAGVAPTTTNGYSPSSSTTSNANPNVSSSINNYNDKVSQNIVSYNENNTFTLNQNDFTKLTLIQGLTLRTLNQDNDSLIVGNLGNITTKLGSNNFQTRRTNIYEYVKAHGGLGDDQLIDIYDLSKQYDLIEEKRNQIKTQTEKLKKALGQTMKNAVSSKLGFDPTIRNIIKIFCAHVEVFLGVIYDVAAATVNNKARTEQLKKFSGVEGALDISTIDTTPSGNAVGSLDDKYYPWPEYRKGDDIRGLTETYLGDIGVLKNPKDVNELAFVDDLLKAFLTASKLDEQISNKIGGEDVNWYPVNPLDSALFVDTTPYKRISPHNRNELINYMVIRAMTFLAYSNKKLTSDEIQTMANLEADAVLKDVVEEKVIQALTQVSIDDFKNAHGVINGKDVLVIKPLGAYYYYDYIFDSDTSNPDLLKVIPLTNGFTGNWNPLTLDSRGQTDIFLTNYNNSAYTFGTVSPKSNDGGVYVKILTLDDYNAKSKPLPEGPTITDGILSLDKLKQTPLPDDVGFNAFGGVYGIQEFNKLDYGDESLNGLSLSYMFYDDANFGKETFNKSNGLAYVRSVSGPNGSTNTTTSPFDVNNSQYLVSDDILDLQLYLDGSDANKVLHKNYGKNRALIKEYLSGSKNITYPFVNFFVRGGALFSDNNAKDYIPVSLFGSHLYYGQSNSNFPDHAKALLFLHSQPWNGLISRDDTLFQWDFSTTIFDIHEIRNVFSNRAGFISVPKLWAAFIGGMLWRADSLNQPVYDASGKLVGGGSGPVDPIIFLDPTTGQHLVPYCDQVFSNRPGIPLRDQYLTSRNFAVINAPMVFNGLENVVGFVGWKNLDKVLLYLPDQVKDEFKRVFFDFVSKNDLNSDISDWDMIRGQLEIFDGSSEDWVTAYTATIASITTDNKLNTTEIKNIYNASYNGNSNWDNYIMVAPILNDSNYGANFVLELKGGTNDNQAVKTLVDNFIDELVIMNTDYKIWEADFINHPNLYEEVSVLTSDLDIYLTALVDKFTKNKDAISPDAKKKQDEQNLFGTSDENLIKFNFYRTLKGVYDKWVGGSEDGDNIIFQCGDRNSIDTALAIKSRGVGAVPSLIDSFRFVTRSFRDIGDEFIINPLPVNDFLLGSPNSSVYDAMTSLLSANNFDFIALPSYINYNDDDELASMFKPITFNEAIVEGASGPSFVCVYVGQSSKNLDFGNSNYPNDGFDVQCDDSGNMLPGVPNDFTSSSVDHENNVAVFAVNFGQQNQNIFKDITLDQSEFTETAESLQITEDISQKGAETNRSFVGQNIFNVYQVRSYKTEIEMMGNAMIQPMMYFQLNNIPMFHGAYMITRVRHNIKPNFMSTHFTGVRIRKPETPLIDVGSLYMNMLDSMTGSDIGTGTGIDNSKRVFGGDVIGDQKIYVGFVTYDVKENDGLIYQEHNPNATGDSYAMTEVGQFMEALAKAWHLASVNETYSDVLYISCFGGYGGGSSKQHSDKSKHKIGLAVDFRPIIKTKSIQTTTTSAKNYDHDANVKLITMAFDLISKAPFVGNIEFDNIILNDNELINIFSNRKNKNGGNIVISSPGHDNHIHFEWYVPTRIESLVKDGKTSEDNIVTSPVVGSATKFLGSLPTASDKDKALGQV